MTSFLLGDDLRRRCDRAPLPPAVVLGTHITGLTEARALARHGIPVIGVDERMRRYASHSSAWAGVVVTPDFESERLIDVLTGIAGALARRPALFISTDEQVKLVSRHGRDALLDRYAVELPSAETVERLMSKEAFAGQARARGWPIPATVAAASRATLLEGMRALRYPVILKPRLKNLASREHASQKAYRCADEAALLRAYDDVGPWEPEVVVQEWIPGTDADVHYSFHYFAQDMREIASFEGRKIRQWIPEVGSTASSEPVEPPVVSALSREILAANACAGFCSVEYKRDPRSGTFYVTEPTVGRVNLQLGTAIANGADLVSRAYFHLQGMPYPGRERRTFDRKWVYLAADWRSARFYVRRGDLSWGAWLRSLRGPRAFAVWRLSDAGMAWGAVRDVAVRGPRALARRVARRLGLVRQQAPAP
jgi:D-aspartate ligase